MIEPEEPVNKPVGARVSGDVFLKHLTGNCYAGRWHGFTLDLPRKTAKICEYMNILRPSIIPVLAAGSSLRS